MDKGPLGVLEMVFWYWVGTETGQDLGEDFKAENPESCCYRESTGGL